MEMLKNQTNWALPTVAKFNNKVVANGFKPYISDIVRSLQKDFNRFGQAPLSFWNLMLDGSDLIEPPKNAFSNLNGLIGLVVVAERRRENGLRERLMFSSGKDGETGKKQFNLIHFIPDHVDFYMYKIKLGVRRAFSLIFDAKNEYEGEGLKEWYKTISLGMNPWASVEDIVSREDSLLEDKIRFTYEELRNLVAANFDEEIGEES